MEGSYMLRPGCLLVKPNDPNCKEQRVRSGKAFIEMQAGNSIGKTAGKLSGMSIQIEATRLSQYFHVDDFPPF